MVKFESGIGGAGPLACCACLKAIRAWYPYARTTVATAVVVLTWMLTATNLNLLKVYRLAVTKQVVKWTIWEVNVLPVQSYR